MFFYKKDERYCIGDQWVVLFKSRESNRADKLICLCEKEGIAKMICEFLNVNFEYKYI